MMSDTNNEASLLSKQSMGGINGGKGFKAQDAYICIKVPTWFDDPDFSMLLNEGSGDIDVRFQRGGRDERHYYQVKDHPVDRPGFADIVLQFKTKHDAEQAFSRFVLAAGGLHRDVKSFQVALERVRAAQGMHQGTATGNASVADLDARIADLKLPIDSTWALAHLHIDDSVHIRTWPNTAESLRDEFVGKTWKMYQQAQQPALSRAFDALQALISASMGKTLEREALTDVIKQAIADYDREAQVDGLSLFLDVWGDPDARARVGHDAVLQWREFFDRDSRQIPTVQEWAEDRLPELQEIQRRFRDAGSNRHVFIRGNAPLSVGLAVGAVFSKVKSYHLTIDQHGDLWTSSQLPSTAQVFTSERGVELLSANRKALCIEISGVRQVRRKVQEFMEASNPDFGGRLQLQVDPELRRWTAADAAAVTKALQRHIVQAVDEHGFKELHIFCALPLGAAILLGHQLNSVGTVQAYEEVNGGSYVPSCRLDLH
jgi:SMODS-associated and fused to various effectors sensor domain